MGGFSPNSQKEGVMMEARCLNSYKKKIKPWGIVSKNKSYVVSALLIFTSTLVGLILLAAIVEMIPMSGKATVKSDPGNAEGAAAFLDICAHGPCPHPGIYHPNEKVIRQGQPDETIYEVTLTIDADHSRLIPSDFKTSRSTIPVNFFGGSFMFGDGLNDNQTLPYFFSRFVPAATVRNYGFSAHGVHNSLKLLEDMKVVPAKINVLLTGAYHSRRASCDKPYTVNHPSYRLIQNSNRLTEYVSRCSERDQGELSQINQTGFDWLYDEYLSKLKLTKLLLDPFRESYNPKQMDLYAALLHDFRIISEERGATPVILYLKEPLRRLLAQPSFADPMLEKLDKEHYFWLDASLGKNFRNVPKKYLLHDMNKHPTALANCHRAKLLVDYLVGINKLSKTSVDENYSCANLER